MNTGFDSILLICLSKHFSSFKNESITFKNVKEPLFGSEDKDVSVLRHLFN